MAKKTKQASSRGADFDARKQAMIAHLKRNGISDDTFDEDVSDLADALVTAEYAPDHLPQRETIMGTLYELGYEADDESGDADDDAWDDAFNEADGDDDPDWDNDDVSVDLDVYGAIGTDTDSAREGEPQTEDEQLASMWGDDANAIDDVMPEPLPDDCSCFLVKATGALIIDDDCPHHGATTE